MITCIIIDDEKPAREFLKKLINQYYKNKIVVLETVESVAKGVEAINTPSQTSIKAYYYQNQLQYHQKRCKHYFRF